MLGAININGIITIRFDVGISHFIDVKAGNPLA